MRRDWEDTQGKRRDEERKEKRGDERTGGGEGVPLTAYEVSQSGDIQGLLNWQYGIFAV